MTEAEEDADVNRLTAQIKTDTARRRDSREACEALVYLASRRTMEVLVGNISGGDPIGGLGRCATVLDAGRYMSRYPEQLLSAMESLLDDVSRVPRFDWLITAVWMHRWIEQLPQPSGPPQVRSGLSAIPPPTIDPTASLYLKRLDDTLDRRTGDSRLEAALLIVEDPFELSPGPSVAAACSRGEL
jgi:hypothetical protein